MFKCFNSYIVDFLLLKRNGGVKSTLCKIMMALKFKKLINFDFNDYFMHPK